MDHDKFNDYRAAVHTGENAEDALGSTAHIAEELAPAMLVAVLSGDWDAAKHYAEQIRDEAASHFASDDNFTGRKDQARDDFDFYGEAA